MTDPLDGPLLREVTMAEAHRSWNRLIESVVETGLPVTLTRYRKPVAVLAPFGWHQTRHAQLDSGNVHDGSPAETPAQAAHRLALTRQRGIDLLETLGSRADNTEPIHPGEILQGEFLSALGVSWQTLAASSGIPLRHIISIVDRRQPITTDLAAALGESLGTTAEFWVNLQREYDRRISG